jgi:hypothetical protein
MALRYGPKNLTKLNNIRITKAYRTISYESAILIAGLIPIDKKIKEIVDLSNIKSSDSQTINDLNSQYLEKKVNHNLSPHPANNTIISIKNIYNDSEYKLKIFTDGSKDDTNVGFAFTVFYENREIHFCKHRIGVLCSVFQSELLAIRESLKWLNIIFGTNSNNTSVISEYQSTCDITICDKKSNHFK